MFSGNPKDFFEGKHMTESAGRAFSITRTVATFGVPFSIIGSIMLLESNVLAFINLQALFIVAGLPFFLLLGSHGRRFIEFLPEALKTFFLDPQEPNPNFAQIARDGEKIALAAGMIGVVIGLINLLGNLADPSNIGPAMAMSLLSIVYGIIFSECFFAVVARAYQTIQSESTSEPKQGMALVFGGIFAFICCFFVMLFSFSPVSEPVVSEQTSTVNFTEIPIETNLGQISEGHTIQFKACLKTSDLKTQEIVDSLVPVIRESIIEFILKKEYLDMRVASAYETLKVDVTSIVNSLLKEKGCQEIPPVIFSEFLIK